MCNSIAIFILLSIVSFPAWSQTLTPTVAEQFLFAAANQDRISRGLPPLRFDLQLAQAARAHALQMVQRQTISHQFVGEKGLAERVGEMGVHFSLVTENVAEAPESTRIHDLWMHSEGHRANLLDRNVGSVGISVIYSRGEYFAVEDFAHLVHALSLPQQEAAISALLTESGLIVGAPSEVARETCALETGYAGTRKPWFVMRFTSSDLQRLPDQLKSKVNSGRYHEAVVGACAPRRQTPFTSYALAVMLYP